MIGVYSAILWIFHGTSPGCCSSSLDCLDFLDSFCRWRSFSRHSRCIVFVVCPCPESRLGSTVFCFFVFYLFFYIFIFSFFYIFFYLFPPPSIRLGLVAVPATAFGPGAVRLSVCLSACVSDVSDSVAVVVVAVPHHRDYHCHHHRHHRHHRHHHYCHHHRLRPSSHFVAAPSSQPRRARPSL